MLDTNVVSDFMREHPTVTRYFNAHDPTQLCMSAVTVLEVEYGFERNPRAREKYEFIWGRLQSELDTLPFGARDAFHTALIRHHLNQQGKPIGPYDLQLAGMALARQLTLVTNNTAEFSRVPTLRFVDWRLD